MDKGSKFNPIQILEEDQQIRINKQKIQFEKNRQMLYQAHMGSEFDVLLAVEKTQMEGTQDERNKKMRDRVNQFLSGYGQKVINIELDFFRQRREANYTDENTITIGNQLIIYGVDFLNTKQIKRKFVGLFTETKWIDDSHIKIIFQNTEDAKRGLQMNLEHKSQDLVKLQNQDIQVPKCWFQLQSYFYLNIQRNLYCRYATNQENYASDKDHDYFVYQKAKKDFQKSLVNKQKYFTAMKKYQLIDENHLRMKLNTRGRSQGQSRGGHSERTVDRYTQRRSASRQQSSQRHFENYDSRMSNRGSNNNWQRRNQQRFSRSPSFQNRQKSRQRSRQKNQNDNDNLSIISEGRSQNNPKHSQSIEDIHQSPIRQIQKQAEQDEGLSFILNEQQISSSRQIIQEMANLSFNNSLSHGNFKKRKQQENLSLDINKSHLYLNNNERNGNLDISLRINESNSIGNNNLNTSLNINQAQLDVAQNNLSVSINMNLETMARTQNNCLNTSINLQLAPSSRVENYLNTSINVQPPQTRHNKRSVTRVVIDD